MLKRIVCAVFAASLLPAFICAASDEGVYMPNGSFEQGEVQALWNFKVYDSPEEGFSHAYNMNGRYVHDGDVSLELTTGSMAVGDLRYILNNTYYKIKSYAIDVPYEVTAWIYPEAPVSTYVSSYNAGAARSAVYALLPNQWNKVVYTITPKRVGNIQILINFTAENTPVPAGTKIYVDGVAFNEQGAYKPSPNFTVSFGPREGHIQRYSEAADILMPWPEEITVTYDMDLAEVDGANLYAALFDCEGELKRLAVADVTEKSVCLEKCDIESGDSVKLFLWDGDKQSPYIEAVRMEQTDEYVRTFDNGTDGFYTDSDTAQLGNGQYGGENVLIFTPQSDNEASVYLDLDNLPDTCDYIVCFDARYLPSEGGRYDVYAVYEAEDGSVLDKHVYSYTYSAGKESQTAEHQFEIYTGSGLLQDGKLYKPTKFKLTASGDVHGYCTIDNFAIKEKNMQDVPDLYKEFEDYFMIGAAFSHHRITNDIFMDNIKKHYNTATAESTMLLSSMYTDADTADFTNADKFVNYCVDNGIAVIGHCLIWEHEMQRRFLTGEDGALISKEEALAVMKKLVQKPILRYGNKVFGWDVVNEAAGTASTYQNAGLWYEIIGMDYVKYAFLYAAEAADAVEAETGRRIELYYNDYGDSVRYDNIYAVVKELLDAGCRVDAVGIQSHFSITDDFEKIRAGYEKIKTLGIKMNISELDISVYDMNAVARPIYEHGLPAWVEQKQAKLYKQLFDYYRANSAYIDRVTTWGMTDRHTFRHAKGFNKRDYPLLLDRYYQPKKAFWEILK